MTIKELLIITETELHKKKEGGKVVRVDLRPKGIFFACYVTIGNNPPKILTARGEGATDKIRNRNLVRRLRGNILKVRDHRFRIPKTLTP